MKRRLPITDRLRQDQGIALILTVGILSLLVLLSLAFVTASRMSLLSAELGSETDLFFILGVDVLGHLDQWKNPVRVLELCRLLVVGRPGEQDFDWPGFYRRVPRLKTRSNLSRRHWLT